MAQNDFLQMNSSGIGITRIGSKSVLTPRGAITYRNIDNLKSMFNECIGNNKTEIILDCKAISFLDSEVLEYILKIHEELRNQGGILKLININAICRDIFLVTRLINVFYIYDDIHKAIRNT